MSPRLTIAPGCSGLRAGVLSVLWSVVCATTACAALGEGGVGGGGSGLPNRGVGGYALHEDEAGDAWVLRPLDDSVVWSDPSALVVDGHVEVYFTESTGTGRALLRVESDDGVLFGDPAPVLDGHELGSLGAPAVAFVGDGGSRRTMLAFELGQGGALGLVEAAEGAAFDLSALRVLEPEAPWESQGMYAPSIVDRGDGVVTLYYEARDDAGRSAIARLDLAPDGTVVRRGTALSAGDDCLAPDGTQTQCWDRDGVGSPEVKRTTTATDREVWRMLYTGFGGGETHLGFAFSFDGEQWTRYDYNPLLARARIADSAASNVLFEDRYLLYFFESRTRGEGIALAISAFGQPSERF